MENLTSITVHSDWLFSQHMRIDEKWDLHRNRVNFGRQSLEKWMFIPCDKYGNVLEEPERIHFSTHFDYAAELEVYKEAKGRCLFENISIQNTDDWISFYGGIRVYVETNVKENMFSHVFRKSETTEKTIEDLAKYNLELTPTAKNQIGL